MITELSELKCRLGLFELGRYRPRCGIVPGMAGHAHNRLALAVQAHMGRDCKSTRHLDRRAMEAVFQAYFADARVKRILHTLVLQYKMFHLQDEIQQRVAVLLFERFLPRMLESTNPEEDVYKYLYAITFNVIRTIKTQRKEDVALSFDSDEDDDEMALRSTLAAADNAYEEVETRLDQGTAAREWARRKVAVGVGARCTQQIEAPIEDVSSATDMRIAQAESRGHTADMLLALRDQFGLTNKTLAALLGISQSTLAAYMYGRVTEVAPSVIQQAGAIANDLATRSMNPRERFLVESSMVQIVQDWLEKLHGSEEEAQTSDERKLKEQDLAKVLGVHKTTLWRWQQPETGAKSMRPSLERLRLYDDVVLARLLVLKGIAPALQ